MRAISTRNAAVLGCLACVVAAAIGGDAGSVLAGLVSVVALSAAFLRLPSLGVTSFWRWVIVGSAFLGLSPMVNLPFDGGGPVTPGDVSLLVGCVLVAAGLERVLRVRTQRLQVDVLLDSALLAGWIGLAVVLILYDSVALHATDVGPLATFRYLPCALVIAAQVLRLIIGSPDRSWGFFWLSASMSAVLFSEVGFVVHEAHIANTRSIAVALGGFAALSVALAVFDESAEGLERPRVGEVRSAEGLRDVLNLGSLFLLLVGIAVFHNLSPLAWEISIGLGLLSFARIYVLFRERRRWVEQEKAMQFLAADLLEAEDRSSVLSMARDTLVSLLEPRRLLEIEFYERRTDGWDTADSSGVLTAIPSDEFDRIAASQVARHAQLPWAGTGRFISRYTGSCSSVPLDEPVVVVAEGLPVFTEVEVAQIETTAKTVRLALDALSEREQAHRRRADRRFRSLSQDSNDIVALVSEFSFRVELLGPTLERLLGHEDSVLIGASPLALVHPKDREELEAQLDENEPGVFDVGTQDVRLQHANGRYHWFALQVRDLRGDLDVEGLLFSFRDVHDRKMAELQVRESESRYRALVRNASDVFAIIDRNDVLTYVSPNVNRVLGFAPGDLIGTKARSLLTPAGAVTMDQAIQDCLVEAGESFTVELRTSDRDVRFVSLRFAETTIDGEPGHLITAQDVTGQRTLEMSLREQALSDPLTGLFNRAALLPAIQKSFHRAARGELVALLHLTISDFNELNTTLGFNKGDVVLCEVADRIQSDRRGEDLIARLHSDEFMVLLQGLRSEEAALDVAASVASIFDEPFVVDGRPMALAGTVGVATTSDQGASAIRMAENASLACAHGRSHGHRVTLYDEEMRSAARERIELATDLRARVDSDEFTLVYQPLFDLAHNKVTSVEALLRWNHPVRGHVSPGLFIPLAEETGSIVELGRMVMRRACAQLVEWTETLPGGASLSVAVNVSARQLEPEGEGETLRRIVQDSDVDPTRLTLELTESTMIEDADWLRQQLEQFKALGCRIAVDDFGTGAAGLAHLRSVPFDVLKIDKAYVDNIETSAESASLITGVIELAHGLNTRIVAEGIETPAQLTMLKDLGCDYGQGFFLGRPMEVEALENWIGQGWEGAAAAVILDAAEVASNLAATEPLI